MKIGFTGTKKSMTPKQKKVFTFLISGKSGEFHHGDCIGADAEAHDIIKKEDISIHIHPPEKNDHRAYKKGSAKMWEKRDYLARNKDIVEATEILIATPKGNEVLRSGTWATIRYAKKNDKIIYIIMPDGNVIYQGDKDD